MRSVKILIRLRGCAGRSESSLVAQVIPVGFVVHWLNISMVHVGVPPHQ